MQRTRKRTARSIPTEYAGCLFRSRTEARWSVFFDLLGLRWEYEPEGYRLEDGTWYLPDFWMPDVGCYAEVKPGPANEDEWGKAVALAEETGASVLLLAGAPWPKVYDMAAFNDGRVTRMRFCWLEKYTGTRDTEPHDGEPRIYWEPCPYEAEKDEAMVALMQVARHIDLTEPNARLPLGWENVEIVT